MKHEYSPQVALELLMHTLDDRDQELSARVRDAVNAGTDVQEREQTRGRETDQTHSYRHTVPYSYEQALQVALEALRAHFIEQPLFINSVLDNMVQSPLIVASPESASHDGNDAPTPIQSEVSEKAIEIELYTETQLVREPGLTTREPEVKPMRRTSTEEITRQQANLNRLRELFDFREAR
jgi:hypothetical protein